jgi:hypothetical protein
MRLMPKTLCLLFCLICVSFTTIAQRSELGFGLGTLNYTGDLVKNYNFRFSKPAATVFYRSNLSNVVSFRAAITAGKLGASEKPIDAFSATRNASFNIFLFEASTVMEYHFLNWRETKRFVRFTPYVFAGLGVFGMAGTKQANGPYSNIQAAIPFGGGIKYIYNPKWYLSLEFGVRKTWFDYLDDISDSDIRYKQNTQHGNPNDNDSYYFLGVTLTRTFYTIPCPTNPYK